MKVNIEDLCRHGNCHCACIAAEKAKDAGGNRNPIGEAYGGKGLDLVICGGESGPGARPMELEWARSVRDQCVAAGVPFFFKQWGGCGKKRAGRLLDGREWNELPK